MARASDLTEKETCTMRTCELVMSHWSLHRSNHPRRASGGDRGDQDEADQPEQLKRVLAARQPTELERQKHFQTNHAVFAPWCEVCVKAKGTGAQHRRQTIMELSKQEGWTQNLLSDACVEIQQGRIAATAFGAEGLEVLLQASSSRLEFEGSSTRVTENRP